MTAAVGAGAAMPMHPEMTRRERTIFAAGDIFGGGQSATLAVMYLFYLTDIVGLGPGLAGTTIVASKVWDAVNHPLMGIITDRTRTRWGRRRPWILIGALFVPPALAALWAPIGDWQSETSKVVFVIAAHLLWTTVASIIAVPYGSLSTEVTTDPAERSRINVLRMACSMLSAVGCTLVMNLLVSAYTDGTLSTTGLYLALVVGFGLTFSLPLVLVACFTHERAPVSEHPPHFTPRAIVQPLRLESFRRLTVLYLCPALTIDIVTSVVIYYALYVVPGVKAAIFAGTFALVSLLMVPALLRLVARVDKQRIYYTGIPLGIIAMTGVAFYPSGWPTWPVYVLAALMAVGLAAAQIMVWVMFPDVVDDGELRQGERNTGSFSGLIVLVRTLASALAIWFVGIILQLTSYHQPVHGQPRVRQPESALVGIRMTMFVAVLLLMGNAWVVARGWPLTRARCDEITRDLVLARERRHAVVPEHPAGEPPEEYAPQ